MKKNVELNVGGGCMVGCMCVLHRGIGWAVKVITPVIMASERRLKLYSLDRFCYDLVPFIMLEFHIKNYLQDGGFFMQPNPIISN